MARLRQILVNLVGNAIKFTSTGEVIVSVQATPSPDGDLVLRVAVRDTGIGIAPEKQDLVFDAFTQADTSTTRQFGGTGLGLAIASRLTHAMGGTIGVESELEKGSTFQFTVRLRADPDPAPVFTQYSEADLRGLSVLVVDDNATNCRILEEMLSSWHMRPSTVRGGVAAISAMRAALDRGKRFPLILLDAQMPGMDGFAVAEEIRRNPALTGSAIMMLSSAERHDPARCRELGITIYLTKPVRQSQLFDAIQLTLGSALPTETDREPFYAASVPPGRSSLNILVVEDNAVNQKLAVALLKKRGHKVVVACNGIEGVDAHADGVFDLILMDVQMPEMGGFEATAIIRERELTSGRRTPIVAMTARAMSGDREGCLEAGMDEYVAKPVNAETLFAAVDRALGHPPVVATAKPPDSKRHVFDSAALLAVAGGDAALATELAELFLGEAPQHLTRISGAIARSDSPGLQSAAHALRGSAASMTAREVAGIAGRLEAMGVAGDFTGSDTALVELTGEMTKLSEMLELLTASNTAAVV